MGSQLGRQDNLRFSPACRGWSSRSWLLGASPGSLGLGDLGSSLLGAGVPVEGVRQGEAGKPLEGVTTCHHLAGYHTPTSCPQTEAQKGEASCSGSCNNASSHVLSIIPWVGVREKPATTGAAQFRVRSTETQGAHSSAQISPPLEKDGPKPLARDCPSTEKRESEKPGHQFWLCHLLAG